MSPGFEDFYKALHKTEEQKKETEDNFQETTEGQPGGREDRGSESQERTDKGYFSELYKVPEIRKSFEEKQKMDQELATKRQVAENESRRKLEEIREKLGLSSAVEKGAEQQSLSESLSPKGRYEKMFGQADPFVELSNEEVGKNFEEIKRVLDRRRDKFLAGLSREELHDAIGWWDSNERPETPTEKRVRALRHYERDL